MPPLAPTLMHAGRNKADRIAPPIAGMTNNKSAAIKPWHISTA